MKRLRILLWGWFGYENLGDDLLLEAMLNNLDCKNWKITVPMKKKYDCIRKNVDQIKRDYITLFLQIRKNDVLVIGPGGLFPIDNIVKVLVFYVVVILWKISHKRVVFYGIGISEKISKASAILWRKIIRKADLFVSRSEDILKRLNVLPSEKVHSMADVAFLSDIDFDNETTNCHKVAISVANLGKSKNNQVEIWGKIVKEFLNKGYEIDLIAFTKRTDDQLIDLIKSEAGYDEMIHTIYYDNVYTNIRLWRQYELVIAMRFHALVLSILANVPVVPIAYGHKTASLAKKCGIENYTLFWNDQNKKYYGKLLTVTAEQVIDRIKDLFTDLTSIKRNLEQRRQEFRESAAESMDQLKEVLCNVEKQHRKDERL